MSGYHAVLVAVMLVSALFAFGNGMVPNAAVVGGIIFYASVWLLLVHVYKMYVLDLRIAQRVSPNTFK